MGVVVINRQRMKNKLFALYQSWDAVNKILEKSRPTLPEKYLALCAEQPLTPQGETLRTVRDTKLMTLPCGNETDARSVAVQTLPEGKCSRSKIPAARRSVRHIATPAHASPGCRPDGEGIRFVRSCQPSFRFLTHTFRNTLMSMIKRNSTRPME